MGGIFSSKRKHSLEHKVTDVDRAKLSLMQQRDKLKQMYKRYEKNVDREKERAREMIRGGRKDRALVLLKHKRYQETVMERIYGYQKQVEDLIIEIESAELTKQVLERLELGNKALKELNAAYTPDDAQRIMEECAEQREVQQEITDIISNLTPEDNQAAEEELEELLRSEAHEKLPSVPTHELPETLEEREETVKPTKEKKQRVALEAS